MYLSVIIESGDGFIASHPSALYTPMRKEQRIHPGSENIKIRLPRSLLECVEEYETVSIQLGC